MNKLINPSLKFLQALGLFQEEEDLEIITEEELFEISEILSENDPL